MSEKPLTFTLNGVAEFYWEIVDQNDNVYWHIEKTSDDSNRQLVVNLVDALNVVGGQRNPPYEDSCRLHYAIAKIYLPELAEIINEYFKQDPSKHVNFMDFTQRVIDCYMMHECSAHPNPYRPI